jgi:hypothetical protein
VEWLEPWTPTERMDSSYHESFLRQLRLELAPGHELFGLPVKLVGRGNGDDALFSVLDGSNRVATVHLTWAKNPERLPFPLTTIYQDFAHFTEARMRPEHLEWVDE